MWSNDMSKLQSSLGLSDILLNRNPLWMRRKTSFCWLSHLPLPINSSSFAPINGQLSGRLYAWCLIPQMKINCIKHWMIGPHLRPTLFCSIPFEKNHRREFGAIAKRNIVFNIASCKKAIVSFHRVKLSNVQFRNNALCIPWEPATLSFHLFKGISMSQLSYKENSHQNSDLCISSTSNMSIFKQFYRKIAFIRQ